MRRLTHFPLQPYGFHLSDGTLYTYIDGTQYEDIAGAWDWNCEYMLVGRERAVWLSSIHSNTRYHDGLRCYQADLRRLQVLHLRGLRRWRLQRQDRCSGHAV